MRLDPLYPDLTLYFLAEARISLGQFDEAVAALKQRLERNPNSETSYALLAACYGHLGRVAESQAAWAEVMRTAPDFSIERRRRILPLRTQTNLSAASRACERRVFPYSTGATAIALCCSFADTDHVRPEVEIRCMICISRPRRTYSICEYSVREAKGDML